MAEDPAPFRGFGKQVAGEGPLSDLRAVTLSFRFAPGPEMS